MLRDNAAYMRDYRSGKGKKHYELQKQRAMAKRTALRRLQERHRLEFNRLWVETCKNMGVLPPNVPM